ncbi:MAG: SUMF1/EgtB/PvdO family nonheme iron enzyme, partial [Cyclobacteriaceae bacterium]
MRKILIIIAIALINLDCEKANNQQSSNNAAGDTNKVQNNSAPIPLATENEMILVQGGEFVVGSADFKDQFPPVPVKLKDFYLDKTPVTVAQFNSFIEATGYVTDAEKFGNSGVYQMNQRNWILKPGTYWQYPLGPEAEKAQDNHPVTHISWNDAVTYAQWAGKRLPSEIEWEYAARSGKVENIYPWGKNSKTSGKHLAN